MADDHRPKITARREDQQTHQNAERAGDRDAERILVSVRESKERALQETGDDPRTATSAEQHRQTLHKKSAKREFFVETRPDKCIQNSEKHELQISLNILELA